MAGTKEGGLKAAETNKERYGKDFYKLQGRKGGAKGRTGGRISRLPSAKKKETTPVKTFDFKQMQQEVETI